MARLESSTAPVQALTPQEQQRVIALVDRFLQFAFVHLEFLADFAHLAAQVGGRPDQTANGMG